MDLSNGNTLNSLAFAANSLLKTNVTQRGITDPLMACFDNLQIFECMFNFYRGGLLNDIQNFLTSFEKVALKILPFYQYFFDLYKPSQKTIILHFLSQFQIYDEKLYSSLITPLNELLTKAGNIKSVQKVLDLHC